MFQSSMIISDGLAFIVPITAVLYTASSSPRSTSSTPATNEEAGKPLENFMQPPVAELDPLEDNPYAVEQLKNYKPAANGEDLSKLIYVASKGTIFAVSRRADGYGKGGSYHVLAGLKPEHSVADYSGLRESGREVKRYNIVGKVVPTPAPSSL
ncbi:cytochrome b5 [Coprinopsis sp. MPI-PUGE-AT-0042]|nr:cytochrome b5 [Coprinopsis sp. MPI-PUGE-AT-0042]